MIYYGSGNTKNFWGFSKEKINSVNSQVLKEIIQPLLFFIVKYCSIDSARNNEQIFISSKESRLAIENETGITSARIRIYIALLKQAGVLTSDIKGRYVLEQDWIKIDVSESETDKYLLLTNDLELDTREETMSLQKALTLELFLFLCNIKDSNSVFTITNEDIKAMSEKTQVQVERVKGIIRVLINSKIFLTTDDSTLYKSRTLPIVKTHFMVNEKFAYVPSPANK